MTPVVLGIDTSCYTTSCALADMQGNILEGTGTPSSDIQSHIALYQAFPKLGGVVQPHARF